MILDLSFVHRLFFLFVLAAPIAVAATPLAAWRPNLADYVDPAIGVLKGQGSCVIGPQVPFGSVNPSPDSPGGWTDGYTPGNPIRGFSQLHVSGTGGGGKYGQFLISPQVGLATSEHGHDSPASSEYASPAYYTVTLDRYKIRTELSPTSHAAIYRFTFPETRDAHILIDCTHQIPGDIVPGPAYIEAGEVHLGPERTTMYGWGRYYGGWSRQAFRVYFFAEFDRPANGFGVWYNGNVHESSVISTVSRKGDRIGGYFRYETKPGERLLMKIGVSFKSVEQAEAYLAAEIPGWDLESVRQACTDRWDEELGRIMIDGGTEEQKRIFYTALYHAMVMPRDRTGDNPDWDSGEPYYDDQYCLWDTWRTVFPLLTLVRESVVRDNIRSFIDRFNHHGLVADAFIAGNEYDFAQGGDDVDNIIAEAFAKGVAGVDWEAAYRIVKFNAENRRVASYRENDRGWVPNNLLDSSPNVSCSKTLAYAYNDYCAAMMAKGLGKGEDYSRFLSRSRGWENLWRADLSNEGYAGFISPRNGDGRWRWINPRTFFFWFGPYFYEGTSWTYSYFVPHDLARLIELTGGRDLFTARLAEALDKAWVPYDNEPSFLAVRSFSYALRPDLTSLWTRKAIQKWTAAGYPGDDDSGAMSSWFILSALGLFPNAGQDIYLINGPLFPYATVGMENGCALRIEALNTSDENIYIQSATLNGKPLERAWLRHDEIKNGAALSFVMGATPTDWGQEGPPPPSSPVGP